MSARENPFSSHREGLNCIYVPTKEKEELAML